jgi:hypothetical protein
VLTSVNPMSHNVASEMGPTGENWKVVERAASTLKQKAPIMLLAN